jgi:hypothetical protein
MLSEKKAVNPFTERQYDNSKLLDKIRQGKTHLNDQITEAKQKFKIIENKTFRKQALTRPEDLVKHNDVTVTRLLAKRFATPFNTASYQKSRRELQVALLSLSALLIIVSGGWIGLSNTNFLANGDFAYNAGLLGGFLMLCSIFYALLKRIRFINALGKNETWFYAHLVCGIVGPLLIIFHTTFQIKSINSGVAFFCLLAILLSGLFGRYFYTHMSYRSHRIYRDIGDVELDLLSALQNHHCSTSKPTKAALTKLIVNGLKTPKWWYQNIPQMIKMFISATSCYRLLMRDIKSTCSKAKKRYQWDKVTYKEMLKDNKHLVRNYIYRIIKLSLMSMAQNSLTSWRTFHINLLYLLALTATAHIIAVHMY